MGTKLCTLLTALLLLLALPTASQAHVCKHPNLAGLWLRLASANFDPAKTDKEIVGGFWHDLKALKDAAHAGQASLDAYSTSQNHAWMVGYGTADELWATLNASDYHMRNVMRDALESWHRLEVPPKNISGFLECQANKHLGRDLNLCGCAP